MNTTLKKKQRRILTPTEKEKFEERLQEDKADRTETESTFPGEVRFPGVEDGQISRIRKTIKEGEPDSLNKYERDKREKRAVFLKSWLIKHMVPKSHVHLRAQSGGVQNPEFRRAVDEMARVEMSPEYQKVASEYKNIMRELGRPEDANLEFIRPDSR